MLSCRFKDDRDGHVFEIQIHHAAFTSTRSTLGGHDVYAVFRCVLEALEVAGVDLSASEEAPQLAYVDQTVARPSLPTHIPSRFAIRNIMQQQYENE